MLTSFSVQAGYHPESPATLFFGVTVGDVAYWADSLLMAGLLRFAARPFQRLGGPQTAPAPAKKGWWARVTRTAVTRGVSDNPSTPQELQSSRTLSGRLAELAYSRQLVVEGQQLLGNAEQVPRGFLAAERAGLMNGPAGAGSNEMGYLFQVRYRLHKCSRVALSFNC